MPRANLPNRRMIGAVTGGALAVVLIVAGGTGPVIAADDELPDDSLLRNILTGLGLKKPGMESNINYHERSPLVVPPSRDLPPPEPETATKNPAWPVDADVKKRKEAIANRKKQVRTSDHEESLPLRPDEIEKGRTTSPPRGGGSESDIPPPLKPQELGTTGIFSNIGRVFSSAPETATFAGEPARSTLTEPPPGYRTPSPSQPYGVGTSREPTKTPTAADHAEGWSGRR